MNVLKLKEFRNLYSISRDQQAEMLGITLETLNTWEYRTKKIPEDKISNIKYVFDMYVSSLDAVNEDKAVYKTGTPYYDIDFTAGFLEISNSQTTVPDAYITHPFFKGCDYVVRASGQSMAKVIKHGDAIGLIEIKNWRDFLQLGEIYAIVTDEYRMIKIITKGDNDDTFTLISKPSDGKSKEFPEQQLPKKMIRSIYKVQASSHLF